MIPCDSEPPTPFLVALAEGFCPECLVPLGDGRYCPACEGWWS